MKQPAVRSTGNAICLCLTGGTFGHWVEQIREHGAPADLFELRFDLIAGIQDGDISTVVESVREEVLPAISGRTWIATARREDDLGAWSSANEERRVRLLTEIVDCLGPDYVDLEEWFSDQRTIDAARRHGTAIIRSTHDSSGVPENPTEVLARIGGTCRPGDIAKLAATPRSAEDLRRLLVAARTHTAARHVVIGMGEYGLMSRAAPWLFRSEWSYASAREGRIAAPGQYSPRDLSEVFRFNEAREGWRVFAVLGSPVAHSRSPEYHNARFFEDNVNAVYVPVRADDYGSFESLASEVPFAGVSVTVPHKKNALRGARERTSLAERAGAANTLVRIENGWWATNTDVEGFLAALPDIGRASALVVGAGGAARAVLTALLQREIAVTVCNRTVAHARKLARDFGLDEASACGLDGPFDGVRPDVVVQTTSVGMAPATEVDPLPNYRFRGNEIVYDVVYTPERTAFLKRAEGAGCRIITGRAMFEAQAAAQYRIFTGSHPPRG